jgi:predicted MFS family arabinose efflux permease
MPLALFALMLSAFAIGTTEFVIVGLIPTVAQDLSVSLPSVGLLVSLYALGVVVHFWPSHMWFRFCKSFLVLV